MFTFAYNNLKNKQNMYRAIQNKKYYIAVETFRKQRKSLNKVYISGIRIWDSYDSKTYSIVIYTFRIMFSIKKQYREVCKTI